MGVAEASVLEAQVETCRQLLELEPCSRGEPRPPPPPQNPGRVRPTRCRDPPSPVGRVPGRGAGCLLTLVLLLSALDPLGHEEEIRRCLRDLQVGGA